MIFQAFRETDEARPHRRRMPLRCRLEIIAADTVLVLLAVGAGFAIGDTVERVGESLIVWWLS